MLRSALFLILLLAFSFEGSANQTLPQPPDSIREAYSIPLDSLWQILVFDKGGCLTGGQRVRDGKFGNEGCVLTNKRRVDWSPFFSRSDEELTDFLLTQLADTSETNIHTCPFFTATNGEVAVYCLSKIHLVNWYDLKPFLAYKDREISGSDDNEQTWLQAILEDPKQREVLITEWRKL